MNVCQELDPWPSDCSRCDLCKLCMHEACISLTGDIRLRPSARMLGLDHDLEEAGRVFEP